jgi:putative ABC transport system permease protein
MAIMRRLVGGLRGLFREQRVEQELDEELRAYLETAVEQKMSAGMNRKAAQRAARVEMGGLEATKDMVRDVSWESLVASVWQDLRYALRTMRKSTGFAAVAVLTLALGIGANTAIFSVVNSLLLRALPVVEPQRLVTVSSARMSGRGYTAGWGFVIWEQIRQRAQAFDGAFAWSGGGPPIQFNLAAGGETQPVEGIYVSGDFFKILGVPPLLGRMLTSADDVRDAPNGPVAVISYGLWQRRFGGAADIVGRPLIVERVPFTIVGVTPPEFFGTEVGRSFDVALPIGAEPLIKGKETWLNPTGPSFATVMLRLKPGQSVDAATALLRSAQAQIFDSATPTTPVGAAFDSQLRQEFLNDPFTLVPAGVGTSALREQYGRPLVTVLAIVALVLLIACANIANLLLARAAARRHEMSVRVALGASRWRVARQALTESLVLSGFGAVIGLILAAWGSRALVAQLSTRVDRVFLDLALDWRVLAFTASVTALTAVLFGTAPALRATRVAPIEALKEHGRGSDGGKSGTLSGGLVVAQIALSLVLVVAAGLFVRTFARLASVPLGFDNSQVLVVNVSAAQARIDPAARLDLYQRLVDAVAAAPGVASAAGSQMTPINAGLGIISVIDVPGGAPRDPQRSVTFGQDGVATNLITPGWFATYGLPLHAGRDISSRDTRTSPPITLVNEAFVRRYFPDGIAIGRTVIPRFGPPGQTQRPITIVGVAGDAVFMSLRHPVPPTMYEPLTQWPMGNPPREISISVRAVSGSPARLSPAVAAALIAVNRDLAFSFRPFTDQVNASLAQERLVAMLSGFFGALALLLAGLGLYGVTSYTVTRRQNEIGIRVALGAQWADVMALVLRQSLILTAIGIAAGLAAAAALTRYLEGMLFGITPLDPITFVGVALLFAAVAAMAAFVPARRAANVDPNVALRCE